MIKNGCTDVTLHTINIIDNIFIVGLKTGGEYINQIPTLKIQSVLPIGPHVFQLLMQDCPLNIPR